MLRTDQPAVAVDPFLSCNSIGICTHTIPREALNGIWLYWLPYPRLHCIAWSTAHVEIFRRRKERFVLVEGMAVLFILLMPLCSVAYRPPNQNSASKPFMLRPTYPYMTRDNRAEEGRLFQLLVQYFQRPSPFQKPTPAHQVVGTLTESETRKSNPSFARCRTTSCSCIACWALSFPSR